MLVVILHAVLLVELFLVLHAHFELVQCLPEDGVSGNFHWCSWVVRDARFAHFHIGVSFGGGRLRIVVRVRGLTLPIGTNIRSAILTS